MKLGVIGGFSGCFCIHYLFNEVEKMRKYLIILGSFAHLFFLIYHVIVSFFSDLNRFISKTYTSVVLIVVPLFEYFQNQVELHSSRPVLVKHAPE